MQCDTNMELSRNGPKTLKNIARQSMEEHRQHHYSCCKSSRAGDAVLRMASLCLLLEKTRFYLWSFKTMRNQSLI